MYDSINESDSLLSSSSYDEGVGNGDGNNDNRNNKKGSSKKKLASATSLMINRLMIILLLAGLVAVSICFQSLQSQLTGKLSTDEEKISNLEMTVLAQGTIIARFNESVTNGDVLEELHLLEKTWDGEKLDIYNQLNQTKTYVDEQLNSTMIELDETVTRAETEIHDQVDSVKKNFDQYVIHTEHQFSLENNFMIYQVAGTFTVLSCLISMWHMGSHTRKMNQPAIQRKILAILWMCPIYAVTSSLSLVMPKYSGYLGIVKDSYEAYIIYQFLSFCISVIGGGDRNKAIDLLAKRADHLTPPFRFFFCCKPHYENDRALASAILLQCQAFTMQFIFWKPVTSIATVILKNHNYYGPYATDAMDWKSIQFWINIIQNLSIFVAFTGLLKFYHAVDKDLEWCRPFAKFLCIKGVVFMTFWQGMVLKILAETTDMGGGGESADAWSEQVQNFLICLEMLLFSIAHFYCFPVDEWEPGYEANFRKGKFGETMALNDFFSDLKIIMTAERSSKKKKKRRSKTPTESTILEEDGETETDEGSVRSVLTGDEEDPKDAFVRALTSSVRSSSDENDDEQSSTQPTLQEAEQRLGEMLDDMLFSPRNSTQNSPITSIGKKSRAEDEGGLDDEESQNYDNGGKAEVGHYDEECVNVEEEEEEEDPKETSGLLTGDSASSLVNNLRPSIFTNISQQQSVGEDVEDDDDNNTKPTEFDAIAVQQNEDNVVEVDQAAAEEKAKSQQSLGSSATAEGIDTEQKLDDYGKQEWNT